MTLVLDPSQERAVELVCSKRGVGLITGGPGTGKTTCLKTALDRLDARGVKYELCAPTGKAANRVEQTTDRPARTIHRLLEYQGTGGFARDASNPIGAELVVVDESSMIDIELGAALLSAIHPERGRIVFMGDANQLPPVGPGRLFGDLVDSELIPMVRLEHLHRSALESWVAVSAPKMLAGKLPDLASRKDFRFYEVESVKDILPCVRDLASAAAAKDVEAQVLIPQRPGAAGIDAANHVLQETLNPRAEADDFYRRGKVELRLRDRVIQTKNDYALQVFNGEVGVVVDVSPSGVAVQYDGRDEPTAYSLEQANALQLAYALTVHRAQGSEFPWVIAVVHSTHSYILTRQLVYTAVTRAKVGVIIVGDRKGLKRAVCHEQPKRNTSIIERLNGTIPPLYQPLHVVGAEGGR
jgi:exodeoxyribonuclease V alpha subunit